MKRTIIKINEDLCDGCGLCVKGCHEGALQIIDGKAKIVNETYCDGLGACIGDCPVGAITLEEREAKPYDEKAVMEKQFHACPGSEERSFAPKTATNEANTVISSQLTQWPVQLHLLNPEAPFLRNANMVLAADCTAFAYGDFHRRFIKNNHIAIACPKLDQSKEIYVEKLTAMIDHASIQTLTVLIMEVPCCGGLMQMALLAQAHAMRKIPIKKIVIGIKGEIQSEDWL